LGSQAGTALGVNGVRAHVCVFERE
jgi:hypothetical protein